MKKPTRYAHFSSIRICLGKTVLGEKSDAEYVAKLKRKNKYKARAIDE